MSIQLNQARLLALGFSRADVAAFTALLVRSGISDNVTTPTDNQKQFEEYPATSLEAVEALRGVDELRQRPEHTRDPAVHQLENALEELRHELAAARGENQALRALYEELAQQVAGIPQHEQLRKRIETIEDRLA